MPIYDNTLTFKDPTAAEVALGPELAAVIRGHDKSLREHLFHLCVIAYGLRKHNLTKSKSGAGGNARGQVFKPEFKAWYEKQGMNEVYGSETNFLIYAAAGRLLAYVRWKVGEKYIHQLPKSLAALYQCSQILWANGDSTDDPRRELFKQALTDPIRDGANFNTLIHPTATKKEIQAWIESRQPKIAAKSAPTSEGPPEDLNVDILVIKAHKDLYKFGRTGKKLGSPDLPQVEQLIAEIQKLIAKHNANQSQYWLQSHLEAVTKTYQAHKNPDFAKNIK